MKRARSRVAAPRGFTLIELMVALLISSLLVGMILAIFSRMSLAYRGQQQIAGVQQVLAAARSTIELDAKQAGLGIAQGFKTASTGATLQSQVRVINSSTGPDQIAFFYGDPSIQAAASAAQPSWPTQLAVDTVVGFVAGDLIVLTRPDTTNANQVDPSSANVTTFTACVVRVASVGATSLAITSAAPWGWGGVGNGPCSVPGAGTMVYRFVAHAYRIDTTSTARSALGALQQSPTGGLLGNAEVWTDLAYGFSDIQVALRWYDNGAVDLDGDGDVRRNWYSSAAQTTMTSAATTLPVALLQMSLSLVAHTDRDVEGISTAQTPALTLASNTSNNAIGDRAATVLPTAQPWPDPLLPGLRIYRYTTFQVDFRNLGVGQ